jgi:hypothetical protein
VVLKFFFRIEQVHITQLKKKSFRIFLSEQTKKIEHMQKLIEDFGAFANRWWPSTYQRHSKIFYS